MEARVIGIAGGTGCGKSTIVRKISEVCQDFDLVAQDNYYRSACGFGNSNITSFNFDQPEAFDTDLLHSHLAALKRGEAVEMPQYDFVHSVRTDKTVRLEPKKLIIVEGLMVLYDKSIRDLLDLKIFVDTPADIRFIRRLRRDISERGRTVESVIQQYLEVVRPGHEKYIEPTKQYADLIVPEGGFNAHALDVLISYVKQLTDA